MTLDSDNTRFVWIFAGSSLEKGASYNSGVIENVFFLAFGRYVFGTLGNETNIRRWAQNICNPRKIRERLRDILGTLTNNANIII